MSEHFFYVSRNKRAGFYRCLVLLSIVCSVGLVLACNACSYKSFLREQLHVLQEYLDVPVLVRGSKLDNYASFYGLFRHSLDVS